MMKYNLKTILLNSFFLLTFSTVISQNTAPKPVVVGDVFNFQVIYPLGWSEDGIFAYIHQSMDGEVEIYSYTVIIQNIKTNKKLWIKHIEYNFEIEGAFEKYNYDSDSTMYNYAFFKQITWVSYGQKIEEKLKFYNIKRKNSDLHKLTDLPKDISLKESKQELEIAEQYKIALYKKDKFNPVYQFDCKLDKEECEFSESIWYRTFAVKGYFKSPFENRIAILVFKITNGFGEPFEYPFFVGAHLEKGFMDIGSYSSKSRPSK